MIGQAYPQRGHLVVAPPPGRPQRQPVLALGHESAARVRHLVVAQRRQGRARLGVVAAVQGAAQGGDAAARHHRLGHDVHLLLQVVDLGRVLDDLLLVDLVRLHLLLVLLVEGEQPVHLVLDVDALLVLELLRGAHPVDAVGRVLAELYLFARLLGVVEAEDVAVAEYDAVAALQAYGGLDLLAVDVAEGAWAGRELDEGVGLVEEEAVLVEDVRAEEDDVGRVGGVGAADFGRAFFDVVQQALGHERVFVEVDQMGRLGEIEKLSLAY